MEMQSVVLVLGRSKKKFEKQCYICSKGAQYMTRTENIICHFLDLLAKTDRIMFTATFFLHLVGIIVLIIDIGRCLDYYI